MACGIESQAGWMLFMAFPWLISGVPSPRCVVPVDAGQRGLAVKLCYSFLIEQSDVYFLLIAVNAASSLERPAFIQCSRWSAFLLLAKQPSL